MLPNNYFFQPEGYGRFAALSKQIEDVTPWVGHRLIMMKAANILPLG